MSLEGKMKELCRLVWELNRDYGVYVSAAMTDEQEDDEYKQSSCTIRKGHGGYPDVVFWGNRKYDRYRAETERIAEIEKGRGDGI